MWYLDVPTLSFVCTLRNIHFLSFICQTQIPESTFKGVQLRNNKNNVRPANWNSKNSNATEGEGMQ